MYLARKRRGSKTYYYLQKTARVGGKVKTVYKKYIGTTEDLLKKLNGGGVTELNTYSFGRLAALLKANEDLSLVESIDAHTVKRKTNGMSVGQYMLAFIVGRAEKPISKKALEKWFEQSYLRYLWEHPYFVNEQNFWNQMQYLTDDAMEAITDDITMKLVQKGLKPTRLLFDTTNFFTQLEKGQALAKTGHSKEKRSDKNLIGLAMAVSEQNVPFFGEAYPGNENDAKVFLGVVDAITARLRKLKLALDGVVVVMDKGCNSPEGIRKVLEDMHVVGSFKKCQAPELLDIPLSKFKKLYATSKGNVLLGYETKKELFGRVFRVVVSYSEATAARQRARYEEEKKAFLKVAEAMRASLTRIGRGRKLTLNGVVKRLSAASRNYSKVFRFDVGQRDLEGKQLLGWVDASEEKVLLKSLGKQFLFTDLDRKPAEVVRTYNSKSLIEDDFKFLKDKLLIPVKPLNHRLDRMIKVHVWLCVLGLLLYRYCLWLVRKDEVSVVQFVDALDRIRVGFVSLRSGVTEQVVERMPMASAKLYTAFGMDRFLKA